MKKVLLALGCAVIFSISSHGSLSMREAEKRAQQIKDVDYKMHFRLPEKDPTYSGEIEASFILESGWDTIDQNIFLDFTDGIIKTLTVNNQATEFSYDNKKIHIPNEAFKLGTNKIRVEFSHAYSGKGEGFHRSQDSEDKQYYMFSNFEPYDANQAFPNFDQPDIKGRFTLTVDVSDTWQVISNTIESSIEVKEADWCQWTFPTTDKFSTYIFALIAGPYTAWYDQTTSGVKLRLFARESLTADIKKDVAHWFDATKEGFKFFEEKFGPYPFSKKYDQILVPGFNAGAMENVGAVTFNERHVFRSETTSVQKLRRVETIIHELSHMWFGNLVTMKWWGDLWLNESFATFVSNLAISKFHDKLDLPSPWQQFYSSNKTWAYREDDYVTTHPIVGTVRDTADASANFDGITYGKGAAVLKQMVSFVGEENFFAGVRNYFTKYAYKNATRSDFLAEISQASGLDMTAWDAEWLGTSGTNAVKASATVDHGKLSLVIEQFPDEASQIVRTHRTTVGFFVLSPTGSLELIDTKPLIYKDVLNFYTFDWAHPAPNLIIANLKDDDYVSLLIDAESLKTLKSSLWTIKDPLIRQMLWGSLWEMVRHAEMSAEEFVELGIANLMGERDVGILQEALSAIPNASIYSKNPKPLDSRIEHFVLSFFKMAEAGSPQQITLFNKYVSLAQSNCGSERLLSWLNGEKINGLTLDHERRWDIITRLAKNGVFEIDELIEDQKKLDPSDIGRNASFAAQTARASIDSKKYWWKKILLGQDISSDLARDLMFEFHDISRPELTEFMFDDFLNALLNLQQPTRYRESFAQLMCPLEITEKRISQIKDFLSEHTPHLEESIIRVLRKKIQLFERILKARELN